MVTVTKTVEKCKNPWKGKCENTDIEVYIYYKDSSLPICKKCWDKLRWPEEDTGKNSVKP